MFVSSFRCKEQADTITTLRTELDSELEVLQDELSASSAALAAAEEEHSEQLSVAQSELAAQREDFAQNIAAAIAVTEAEATRRRSVEEHLLAETDAAARLGQELHAANAVSYTHLTLPTKRIV